MTDQLKQIYPDATEEVIAECIELAKKYSLDPITKQMRIYHSETLGKWSATITRHGYRKIASSQPGYQGHSYLTVYRGDKITMKDNDILIEVSSESRAHNDLLSAIAYLHDNGRMHFIKISYSDYCKQKHAWDQATGRPDMMMQNQAEILVIQKAYSHLFWDLKAEQQEEEEDDDGIDSTRADLIAYIKENKKYMLVEPTQGLYRCTMRELISIKTDILSNKENKID